MFVKAIVETLRLAADLRAAAFEAFAAEISALTLAVDSGMRPWTYTTYNGTDGSRIFRGGLGLSLVVDPDGHVWRARNYEDFATTYEITATTAEISGLTPDYPAMREYVPSGDGFALVPPLPA